MREDVSRSQRVLNYTIDYTTDGYRWRTLVPAVRATSDAEHATDRPAGRDSRDQYIGARRIDVPTIPPVETPNVRAIRLRCLHSLGDVIHLESMGIFTRRVPWE